MRSVIRHVSLICMSGSSLSRESNSIINYKYILARMAQKLKAIKVFVTMLRHPYFAISDNVIYGTDS